MSLIQLISLGIKNFWKKVDRIGQYLKKAFADHGSMTAFPPEIRGQIVMDLAQVIDLGGGKKAFICDDDPHPVARAWIL